MAGVQASSLCVSRNALTSNPGRSAAWERSINPRRLRKYTLGVFPCAEMLVYPINPTAPERSSDNNTSAACLYDTPDTQANWGIVKKTEAMHTAKRPD